MDAGFWRNKFDPNLTQRDTFHLDEQFTVPVDMMQALTYPLHWFLLEQPEIQVTLDYSGWAWVLGGGKGTVQLWATTGAQQCAPPSLQSCHWGRWL